MSVTEIAELVKNGQIDSFKSQMGKVQKSVRHGVLIYMLTNFDVNDNNIKSSLLMYSDDLKEIKAVHQSSVR